jgi:hypothetical protein
MNNTLEQTDQEKQQIRNALLGNTRVAVMQDNRRVVTLRPPRPVDPAVTIKVLTRAVEIVKEGWCQQYSALDREGVQVPAEDARATRWCLHGAINRAVYELTGRTDMTPIHRATSMAVGRAIGPLGFSGIAFNDAPGRTEDEVAAKLREAARLEGRSIPLGQ